MKRQYEIFKRGDVYHVRRYTRLRAADFERMANQAGEAGDWNLTQYYVARAEDSGTAGSWEFDGHTASEGGPDLPPSVRKLYLRRHRQLVEGLNTVSIYVEEDNDGGQ